ncbi:odorant receptor 4-like [Anthonomus grandis grandis]|uniref:odorant receptor 4-like n=1 Tax=Anthonomus grandis grandis TaxID=2921223 RepID=UPI00216594BE|nr:odorant receptor 4-like [Anthonomus grandis grandis]
MSEQLKPLNPNYVTDFFSVNRWMLRCAGLWRPNTSNQTIQKLYTIYAITVFLFVNVWFTFTEFISLFYTYKNQYELIKNVNFFLTHFMGAVKVVFWYFYGHDLIEIMKALEDQRLQYEDYRFYQPGRISHKYKKIGIKYSLLFLLLAHATLLSSYIPPMITAIQYTWYCGSSCTENITKSLPARLPYYSWMPFSYDKGPNYLLAMSYQAGPMISYAYSIVGMDTMYMNIMNCVAGNLMIIQGAFLVLRERCLNRIGENITEHDLIILENDKVLPEMKRELMKIMRHLQVTYGACQNLENIHRYVTLCQVTATLFILCTCLFLVSSAPPLSKQFIAESVYMAAMFFQLFLYCWFGNEVTLKFEEIPRYIWESNWLATDKTFKKNMIFTMMRARRPVYFTAGKFSPLTLPTFVSIIKTSYSIFALIKNSSD